MLKHARFLLTKPTIAEPNSAVFFSLFILHTFVFAVMTILFHKEYESLYSPTIFGPDGPMSYWKFYLFFSYVPVKYGLLLIFYWNTINSFNKFENPIVKSAIFEFAVLTLTFIWLSTLAESAKLKYFMYFCVACMFVYTFLITSFQKKIIFNLRICACVNSIVVIFLLFILIPHF